MTRNPLLLVLLDSVETDLDRADELMAAGRPKDAIAIYSAAFYEGVDRPRAAAWAARCCLELRNSHEAKAWALWLEEQDRDLGRVLGAVAAAQLHDSERVAALAEGCDPTVLERVGYGWEIGAILSAAGCLERQQPDEAVALLADAIETNSEHPDLWVYLTIAIAASRVVPDRVVDVILRNPVVALAWMQSGDPQGADALLEAVWAREPGNRVVLAIASEIAPRIPLDRAVVWSGRLRIAGLAERCPLRAIAMEDGASPFERVQAAVVTKSAFGDEDAGDLVRAACAVLEAEQVYDGLTVVAELAIDLLDNALDAVCHSCDTSLVAAKFLFDGTAVDGAVAVAAHALQCADRDPMWGPQRTETAIQEILGVDVANAIADACKSMGMPAVGDRIRNAASH